jgi:transcriptional regulator with GAF, ATPase, and Fis domain
VDVTSVLPAGPRAGTAGAPRAATGLVTLEEAERAHIEAALAQTRGVIHGPRGAAAILGLKPTTLRSRMERLGIPFRRAP